MPEPDSRPPIAAAVIVHEGRVLLVQRRVAEGSLSWQFPAGAVEEGEDGETAAVRETAEEAGLDVIAREFLGERVHPATGRLMQYVACEYVDGDAHVADEDEIAAVAWVSLEEIPTYVPYGFYEPVQKHLDAVLVA